MKKTTYILLFTLLLISQTSSAALVRVDITGSVGWYAEDVTNEFGVDTTTLASGHIIYDDTITQTDGTYDDFSITDYIDWEFELNIGNNTITQDDARPRPDWGETASDSWLTFENGKLVEIWFETIVGYDPDILGSRIFAGPDFDGYYPDSDYIFEMAHFFSNDTSDELLWIIADGGLSLSDPVLVSAVPIPASLLLFLSGTTLLFSNARRRKK